MTGESNPINNRDNDRPDKCGNVDCGYKDEDGWELDCNGDWKCPRCGWVEELT